MILSKERGWISKWPKRAVFIYSGGMDSTIVMAKLLAEKKMELFPLFINRGQTNIEYERQSARFFEKCFSKKYKGLFHALSEITITIPPKEIKHNLKSYSKKFGYPLRNTVLQMVGVQYAISVSEKLKKRVSSVLCAQVDDDPFPHSKLIALRATTLDVCQGLGEWDWQITSPTIDPLLSKTKFGKTEMVQWANEHGLLVEKTRSCYSPDKDHCGKCLTCKRRQKAFFEAGITDKTKYSR